MSLIDLDETTRRYMRKEVELDRAAGTLFLSARLSPSGRVEYPDLLLAAIDSGNSDTLAAALRQNWRLNLWEAGRDRHGKRYRKRVPYNAADTLAFREFNRYYIRGLCARSKAEGIGCVEVYRAKSVGRSREELQDHIGQQLDPRALLTTLRASQAPNAVENAFGVVPAGSSSGLSVKLVRAPERRLVTHELPPLPRQPSLPVGDRP